MSLSLSAHTRQAAVIHDALRREMTRLPAIVEAVPVGDTERASVISEHALLVLRFLRAESPSARTDRLMPRIEAELAEWATSAAMDARTAVIAGLARAESRLADALKPRAIRPAAAAPVSEIASRLPADLRSRLLFAGMVMDGADPADEAHIFRELPVAARALWGGIGHRMYAAHVNALRHPPRAA